MYSCWSFRSSHVDSFAATIVADTFYVPKEVGPTAFAFGFVANVPWLFSARILFDALRQTEIGVVQHRR